jgi:hypothetical protein
MLGALCYGLSQSIGESGFIDKFERRTAIGIPRIGIGALGN